ncbi:hypothetical protein TR70_5878 [Burkholderia pseudomallei]|nr:hypothetical protein TR70_5878 [Burkholderia pseudomallei]
MARRTACATRTRARDRAARAAARFRGEQSGAWARESGAARFERDAAGRDQRASAVNPSRRRSTSAGSIAPIVDTRNNALDSPPWPA